MRSDFGITIFRKRAMPRSAICLNALRRVRLPSLEITLPHGDAAMSTSGLFPFANRPVEIPADGHVLHGFLSVPENARGAVVFAHGSGSGRHSPRNQYVAEVLQHAGLATLLLDLLMPAESADRRNVFDIELLASRL